MTPRRGVNTIHVHEDDWGMRNLYPLTVQAEVAADLDAAVAAGERNRDPSGHGWTDMHVIEEPSSNYADAGLLLSDAAAAVEPLMPRVRHFQTWISDDYDAWCFGFGNHCYLKLEVEGEHVKGIWFDLSSPDPEDIAALRDSMLAIDRLVPSFIADYFMEAEVPLSNTELLGRYFDERRTDIEEFDRWQSEQRRNRDPS